MKLTDFRSLLSSKMMFLSKLNKYATRVVKNEYFGTIGDLKFGDKPLKYLTEQEFKDGQQGYILVNQYTVQINIDASQLSH